MKTPVGQAPVTLELPKGSSAGTQLAITLLQEAIMYISLTPVAFGGSQLFWRKVSCPFKRGIVCRKGYFQAFIGCW